MATGLLVECNEADAGAYGLGSVEAAIGTRFADVALLDTEKIRADLTRFVTSGYQSNEKRSETTAGDGRRRVVVSNTTGFVDEGHLYRIWGNVPDVTALVDAEREQDELEERMRAAQKLESLGLLAGGIAHDFNNLLFGIGGYAEPAVPPSRPERRCRSRRPRCCWSTTIHASGTSARPCWSAWVSRRSPPTAVKPRPGCSRSTRRYRPSCST
ncbi:MAG: hypothetical protein ACR2O6_01840 [Ilumatobacteraceae bacterium]